MPSGSDVAVVGGGVLGLALARRLARAGHTVTVYEGASQAGGLASPAPIGQYEWDRFYHVILQSDSRLLQLLAELGLRDRLRWGTTRTGFFVDGRLLSLSSSWDYLRFPALSLWDKARLARTILRASRVEDPRPLETIGAEAWLRRWSGDRVVDRLWLPLLRSKLGENYRRASAAFIWATIARLYAARRSGQKREQFGYVDGGYRTILAALVRRVAEDGVTVRTGARIQTVTGGPEEARVTLSDGFEQVHDEVVMTVPCPVVSTTCPQLEPAERARLEGVVYQGIVCASMLLRRPLADYYVTNITEPWVPFTGIIEMTALVDREQFGGQSLVYLPRYMTTDDPAWAWSDTDVEERFLDAVERMYPDFRRDDVTAFRVARVPHVMALSTLHYSRDWKPGIVTSVPRISVVNSAQIAYGTLNVNETLELVEQALPTLTREFATRPGHAGVSR